MVISYVFYRCVRNPITVAQLKFVTPLMAIFKRTNVLRPS